MCDKTNGKIKNVDLVRNMYIRPFNLGQNFHENYGPD